VTGAAGTIGLELCRHLARLPINRLILMDNNESGIFEVEREIEALPDAPGICAVIGDILDQVKVQGVFQEFQPHVVFHAAAYKHVPLMEFHPREAVRTNTLGTWLLAKEAASTGVRDFVLISTDKAVNPSSVMGATKRLAELTVAGLFSGSQTRFLALRFGNVLGSRGSLVPILQDQIRSGGPITVTDPDMERYCMTSSEAVSLILNALVQGRDGDILVLDMGDRIRLLELARAVARLAGIEPDADIPIVYVGPRPGEKRREELVGRDETEEETGHPMIRRVLGNGSLPDIERLAEALELLDLASETGTRDGLRWLLQQLVPTYAPTATTALAQDPIETQRDSLVLNGVPYGVSA
jgi:FlaA1/EpsC-like NDP-sugar epimerase